MTGGGSPGRAPRRGGPPDRPPGGRGPGRERPAPAVPPAVPPAAPRGGAADDRSAWCALAARAFAELFCEVEAGRRPRAHLAPLMLPTAYARLSPVWVRGGPPRQVVNVQGHLVSEAVYEGVAVVVRGSRAGALCLRLGRTPHGWRVTEAARPEDGQLPTPCVPRPPGHPDAFDLVPP